MATQKNQKKRGWKGLVLYFYMLLILLTLLTVASYTWFSLSRTPRVSDLSMHVASPHGLELAPAWDSETWGQQLDFVDLVPETAPLRPVTWSDNDRRFYAAIYGIDGRLTGRWEPLTDERNANKDNADGYYTLVTIYARTGQDVTVSLSPAVEVDEGIQGSGTFLIGTPVWNPQAIVHNNGGMGAESAVRVGFRISKVDMEGEPTDEAPRFLIYEPNSTSHTDGSVGYTPTPSIDGMDWLVSPDRMIQQTASTWTEAYPIERNVVVRNLGEFTTETELFDLTTEEMARIDIYIWLEGQDVDCTNEINRALIMANIQFAAETEGHSGLVPIEDE